MLKVLREPTREILETAIQIYNKRVDRDYLIIYAKNKKGAIESFQVAIRKENFWHLLGYKIDESLKLSKTEKRQLYEECLGQNDITPYLTYTSDAKSSRTKYGVFMEIFDFVEKANMLRIGKPENNPESYIIKLGTGTEKGIVGYASNKANRAIMFPKTVQEKSISSISRDIYKIVFIFSKPKDGMYYDTLEYKISNAALEENAEQLKDMSISSKLLESVCSSTKTEILLNSKESKEIQHFKEGKGREHMCKIVEDYAREQRVEGEAGIIKAMIKNGSSKENIATLTGLSLEEIEKILAEGEKLESMNIF